MSYSIDIKSTNKLLSFAKAYSLIGKDIFNQVIDYFDDETMHSFIEALPTHGLDKTNISEIIKNITEFIAKKVKRVPDTNCDSSSNPIPWTFVEHVKTLQLINRCYHIPAHFLTSLVPSSESLDYPLKKYLLNGELSENEVKVSELDKDKADPMTVIPTTVIESKSLDEKTETKVCVQCHMPFPHLPSYICKWMNCICCVTSNILPYAIIDDNVPAFMEMVDGMRGQTCAAHDSVVLNTDLSVNIKYSSCAPLCMTCRYKRPLTCDDCKRTDSKLSQIRPIDALDSLSRTLYPYDVKFVCVDGCSFMDYKCKDCKTPIRARSKHYLDNIAFTEELKLLGNLEMDDSNKVVIQLKKNHYVCESCCSTAMDIALTNKIFVHYIGVLSESEIFEVAYNHLYDKHK
jgi:hypothetical protein